MNTIDVLKRLDHISLQASSLCSQCESLKAYIARQDGISRSLMEKHGIFVPEAKLESDKD